MPALRPCVVVVDDDAGFRRAACHLLDARGYDVVAQADSAATLWAVLERGIPDLVILDVGLGAESGFDVARAVTSRHPGLPVLLVSASDHQDGVRLARGSGARGFAPKERLMAVDLEAMRRPRVPRS